MHPLPFFSANAPPSCDGVIGRVMFSPPYCMAILFWCNFHLTVGLRGADR